MINKVIIKNIETGKVTRFKDFIAALKSYGKGEEGEGSYGKSHTEDDCDKCGEKVGRKNLVEVPFMFLDRNDKAHKDMGNGYRCYKVCKVCLRKGV